jgi:hypothetical protein
MYDERRQADAVLDQVRRGEAGVEVTSLMSDAPQVHVGQMCGRRADDKERQTVKRSLLKIFRKHKVCIV